MNAKTALAAAIAALLLAAAVPAAHAGSTYTSRGQHGAATEGDEGEEAPRKRDADAPLFPNATRVDPKPEKGKLGAKIKKVYDLRDEQKYDEAIARAEELLADPKANASERADILRAAGAAASEKGDNTAAVDYFRKAIAQNTLPNNAHYDLMLRLAAALSEDSKFEEVLPVTEQFLAETKSEDTQAYLLRGDALYNLERYPEAIEALKKAIPAKGEVQRGIIDRLRNSYIEGKQAAAGVAMFEQLAAKRPDDIRAQLDLAQMYGEADQGAKAAQVFQRLRDGGKLTDPEAYANAVETIANLDGRENDAIAFINAGLDSGVLKPSAHVYSLLAQSFYYTDRYAEAAAAYEKGAPLSKDGDIYYNLANTYAQIEQWAKAKAAAQAGLAKGMRTPGNAWMIIAAAEDGLGNPAGRIAAYREAAKDPKTRDQANKMLKALGSK